MSTVGPPVTLAVAKHPQRRSLGAGTLLASNRQGKMPAAPATEHMRCGCPHTARNTNV